MVVVGAFVVRCCYAGCAAGVFWIAMIIVNSVGEVGAFGVRCWVVFGCDWFVLVLVVELCCLFVALGCLGVVVVSDRCFMLWLVDFLVVCIVFAFGLVLDG